MVLIYDVHLFGFVCFIFILPIHCQEKSKDEPKKRKEQEDENVEHSSLYHIRKSFFTMKINAKTQF
jgi:hypothetical protein